MEECMDKRVLILGNGISRRDSAAQVFIHYWEEEIWACNKAYTEELEFSRIATDLILLPEIVKFKRKYTPPWQIWVKEAYKTFDQAKSYLSDVQFFTTPSKYQQDSGTSLVFQAIKEDYQICVAGFDLGGADLYVKDHDKINKTIWVKRWREILRIGSDRVTFIGYDHKPNLLSDISDGEYYKVLRKGTIK